MNHSKPRYRVDEAFKLLGLARSEGYKRIKQGKLRAIKDGRRSYVTAAEIDRYAQGEVSAPAAAPRAARVAPSV